MQEITFSDFDKYRECRKLSRNYECPVESCADCFLYLPDDVFDAISEMEA